eukprot:360965-Chlamydomonas_euryale.AAC.3
MKSPHKHACASAYSLAARLSRHRRPACQRCADAAPKQGGAALADGTPRERRQHLARLANAARGPWWTHYLRHDPCCSVLRPAVPHPSYGTDCITLVGPLPATLTPTPRVWTPRVRTPGGSAPCNSDPDSAELTADGCPSCGNPPVLAWHACHLCTQPSQRYWLGTLATCAPSCFKGAGLARLPPLHPAVSKVLAWHACHLCTQPSQRYWPGTLATSAPSRLKGTGLARLPPLHPA